MGDNVAVTRNRERDRRSTRRHGLEENNALTLLAGGRGAENIATRVVARHVFGGRVAGKANIRARLRFEMDKVGLDLMRPGAYDDQLQSVDSRTNVREGTKQQRQSLSGIGPAHKKDFGTPVVEVVKDGHVGVESRCVHTIGNDFVLAREIVSDASTRLFGHGDPRMHSFPRGKCDAPQAAEQCFPEK